MFMAYEMRLNTDSMKSNTAAQSMAAWNAIAMDAATNTELVADQIEANRNGISIDTRGLKVLYLSASMLKSTEFNFA